MLSIARSLIISYPIFYRVLNMSLLSTNENMLSSYLDTVYITLSWRIAADRLLTSMTTRLCERLQKDTIPFHTFEKIHAETRTG